MKIGFNFKLKKSVSFNVVSLLQLNYNSHLPVKLLIIKKKQYVQKNIAFEPKNMKGKKETVV